jgi:hypothetical protein
MAHWAEIDENNIVLRVTVGDNNDPNGDEGYQWLIDNLGGRWIKTSYNTIGGVHYLDDKQRDENGNRLPSGQPHLRYNYAGIGCTYDEQRDAFIPPKPLETENWQGFPVVFDLDEDTCQWVRKVIRS